SSGSEISSFCCTRRFLSSLARLIVSIFDWRLAAARSEVCAPAAAELNKKDLKANTTATTAGIRTTATTAFFIDHRINRRVRDQRVFWKKFETKSRVWRIPPAVLPAS